MIHTRIYIILVSIILSVNTYSQKKDFRKIILKKGTIEMKGLFLSFFDGDFEISLDIKNDSIKNLSFSASVSFKKISRVTTITELKRGDSSQMKLEDVKDFLIQITPINFNENGGELLLLINLNKKKSLKK